MSIPYVTDGVTDIDSALINPWIDAMNASASATENIGVGIYNVLDAPYGATGDGVTDDTTAIQDAIDAATAAGGGTILFPAGTYFCSTVTDSWIFSIIGSNLTFKGEAGAVIASDENAYLFFVCGNGKTAGAEAWVAGQYYAQTLYTLATATKRARQVTLATPAQAANFTADDWIYIQTGQTLENADGNQPDAELNQVVTANSGTGVITLRWPLATTYLQEAVDTGGGFTYRSKVGGAGANVPFGVKNVSAVTIEHIAFRDLTITMTNTGLDAIPILGGQAYDVAIENCTLSTFSDAVSPGDTRGYRMINNRVDLRNTTTQHTPLAAAKGMSDILLADNFCTAQYWGFIHLHEGTKNVRLIRNTVRNPDQGSLDSNTVSVRARAYDVVIQDNIFSGSPQGANIFVDDACTGGGYVTGNTIDTTVEGVSIAASGWTVGFNDVKGGSVLHYAPGITSPIMCLTGWVKHNNQSVELGTIPKKFLIVGIQVHCYTAFNSDGTDLIKVGHSGTLNRYTENVDVSTTGTKTITLQSFDNIIEETTSRTVIATYTNGGTEPSAGEALVLVQYAHVESR
jgi:hypothetical protein